MPVFTNVTGTNADLIAEVARLYLRPDMVVADVTYGKGVFWRKAKANIIGSDLLPASDIVADFRKLPYAGNSVDVVVFDPPYMSYGGTRQMSGYRYNNASTAGMNHAAIMELYRAGITEAMRVSRDQIWVKCQDEVNGGRQHWSHIEIYEMARGIGLKAKDLFVLAAVRRMNCNRWETQLHARKNHSYLWVFTN